MPRWLNATQVAEELELTQQAISLLAKEPDCPKRPKKKGSGYEFEWPRFNRWYWTRKLEAAEESSHEVDYELARARRETALAAQEELKLAKLRGQLMTTDDYRRVREDADARVAARLKALPQKLAPAVVGVRDVAEGLARVQPLIDEIMDELYRAEDVPETEVAA